jgi:hypothetical protein
MSTTMSRPRPTLRDRVTVNDAGPQTGTDTCTIGCKWPNGIVMRLYDVEDVTIVYNGQAVVEKQAIQRADAPEFVLNGFSIDLGKMAGGIAPEHEIVGGYGLTHGIPRDFAEEWFRQNANSAMVKNNLIFMQGREQEARAQARDQKTLKSGVEPIDPNDPAPRAGLRSGSIQRDSAT